MDTTAPSGPIDVLTATLVARHIGKNRATYDDVLDGFVAQVRAMLAEGYTPDGAAGLIAVAVAKPQNISPFSRSATAFATAIVRLAQATIAAEKARRA